MAVAWTDKINAESITRQRIILLNAVLSKDSFAYMKTAAKFSSCLAAMPYYQNIPLHVFLRCGMG